MGVAKANEGDWVLLGYQTAVIHFGGWQEKQLVCDPKKDELYVQNLKVEETLLEEWRGSNVQIDPSMCVKRRKTNRIF